ncbi:hypothetical protein [Planctomyces sp. SH-PL14]|uniref:hypothetical protein n=1 Tax=Planctomyces sp. SH-PL14 TaxID=1632864 RepID=UPI00078C3A49|nr:hypothetical protein [Planctomyces sp. SH-PL14]AMV16592.1 hypothetical protein VT03_01800 [Planctomyces sp. SH-PL14]
MSLNASPPADNVTPATNTAPTGPTRDELLSQMSVYTDAFGAEKGVAWFKEGKPSSTAGARRRSPSASSWRRHEGERRPENEARRRRGESAPLTFSAGLGSERHGSQALARISGHSNN